MSEVNHNCLNCHAELAGKYCIECGQKASTHRITFKHFFEHDLLHGFMHIEKGLVYTILQVFRKGGKAALEYLAGKRVRYYNVFYLSLLLLGLDIVLVSYKHQKFPETAAVATGELQGFYEVLASHVKYVILAFIPLMALNSFMFFLKKKHNYLEHMWVAGFCMVGCLTLSVLNNASLLLFSNINTAAENVDFIFNLLTYLFPIYFYYAYVRPQISVGGYTWRIITFMVIFLIEILVLMLLVYYLLNGNLNISGEFYFVV